MPFDRAPRPGEAHARQRGVQHHDQDALPAHAYEASRTAQLLRMQQTVGNRFVQRLIETRAAPPARPGDAMARASADAGSSVPYRAEMEQALGADFSSVRAHLGGSAARAGLQALGASAATLGADVAFADASPDRGLVAHELAHVVQQRRSAERVQNNAAIATSTPADGAEQAAMRAADAIERGAPVPDVGSAPAAVVHRAVHTNGGEFDTTNYVAVNNGAGVGKEIGADIALKFTPNDLVEANAIGLTQTTKAMVSTAAAPGVVNTPSPVPGPSHNAALSLTTGDRGRAIDQGDSGDADTLPNTNPLYAVENTPGNVSRTLTDIGANAGGTHGQHTRRADGTFNPPVDATLSDGPRDFIAFVGQQWRMSFETTALVLDGPMASTYLGSIEWGLSVDAGGTARTDPNPIRAMSSGAPTADFMAAAARWNAATLTDSATGTAYDTVDLPLTSLPASVQAAVDMTTPDLVARLQVVEGELARLPAASSPDRTNKEFEKRALETELRQRPFSIRVTINHLQDTGSAAVPPEDEVRLRLTAPSGASLETAQQSVRAGAVIDLHYVAGDFWPLTGPLRIEVIEHDRAGTTSSAQDDLVVHADWASPYLPSTTVSSKGEYTLEARFAR